MPPSACPRSLASPLAALLAATGVLDLPRRARGSRLARGAGARRRARRVVRRPRLGREPRRQPLRARPVRRPAHLAHRRAGPRPARARAAAGRRRSPRQGLAGGRRRAGASCSCRAPTSPRSCAGWLAEPVGVLASPDRIGIAGAPRLGGLAVAVGDGAELQGRLVASGSQLHLTIARIRLGRSEAPPLARAILERAVNPSSTSPRYPLPARLDAVEVGDDDTIRIAASGSRLPTSAP